MTKPCAAVLGLLVMASGCASEGRRPANERASAADIAGIRPGVVDGGAAHELVARGVRVLDVRTPQEFRAGHIPGALNIPHDQLEVRYRELGPPSTPLLLYCRTGHRSGLATKTLRDKGFTALYDLKAYAQWVATEPAEDGR